MESCGKSDLVVVPNGTDPEVVESFMGFMEDSGFVPEAAFTVAIQSDELCAIEMAAQLLTRPIESEGSVSMFGGPVFFADGDGSTAELTEQIGSSAEATESFLWSFVTHIESTDGSRDPEVYEAYIESSLVLLRALLGVKDLTADAGEFTYDLYKELAAGETKHRVAFLMDNNIPDVYRTGEIGMLAEWMVETEAVVATQGLPENKGLMPVNGMQELVSGIASRSEYTDTDCEIVVKTEGLLTNITKGQRYVETQDVIKVAHFLWDNCRFIFLSNHAFDDDGNILKGLRIATKRELNTFDHMSGYDEHDGCGLKDVTADMSKKGVELTKNLLEQYKAEQARNKQFMRVLGVRLKD